VDDAKNPTPGAASRPREVLGHPPFALFWSASSIRALGGAVSGVAFNVLIVSVLHATPAQISVLSALGVVPYLFLGLVVGALMDRWRRQRTLVVTSVGRALALASVPLLIMTDTLNFWSIAAVTLILGILVLFADSAAQPLLPSITPRDSLVMANARLGQSATVAGSAGPALGGVLLNLLGGPVLFAIDAIFTAYSAVLQSRIRVEERKPAPREPGRHLGHEIAEGMRYTYRHPTLRPLALSIHAWFLGNSIVVTVFAVFVLRELRFQPWEYGLTLACGGVGGFLGALLAPRIGARLGVGRAIFLARAMIVVPWLALALLPMTNDRPGPILVAIVSAVQSVHGLSMGIEDPNSTGYRQSVAPDAIQGRMNSTIRTVNRVVFFFGSLLAGLLATFLDYRVTLGIGAAIFVVAAVVVILSPLYGSRHGE
jgi:MFS family permease